MKNCGSVRLNRDRKRMQSDESLNNDCSLKKKETYEQFESFSVKLSNQTQTKLETKLKQSFILQLWSLCLSSQTIHSTISHLEQNTILSNIVYSVKLFSIIIWENDSTMATSLKKFPTSETENNIFVICILMFDKKCKKYLVCLSFLIFVIFFIILYCPVQSVDQKIWRPRMRINTSIWNFLTYKNNLQIPYKIMTRKNSN